MAKHAHITTTPERRTGSSQQDAGTTTILISRPDAVGRVNRLPCETYVALPLIQAVPVDAEISRLLARHTQLDTQLAAMAAGAAAITDDAERAEQIHMIETMQLWMRERIAALVDLAADVRIAA